jgi:hypothetical protein
MTLVNRLATPRLNFASDNEHIYAKWCPLISELHTCLRLAYVVRRPYGLPYEIFRCRPCLDLRMDLARLHTPTVMR